MSEPASSLKLYVGIWLTLMVCTALTVGAAFVDLGHMNTVVALTIATFKAILVVLYFMHVKHAHERMIKPVVISGFFFLLLLLGLSMADYTTRLLM